MWFFKKKSNFYDQNMLSNLLISFFFSVTILTTMIKNLKFKIERRDFLEKKSLNIVKNIYEKKLFCYFKLS